MSIVPVMEQSSENKQVGITGNESHEMYGLYQNNVARKSFHHGKLFETCNLQEQIHCCFSQPINYSEKC